MPVRARGVGAAPVARTDEATIRKVLAVEGFEIINFSDGGDYLRLDLKNTKYRSVAQAAVTLQRFTSDATTRAGCLPREGPAGRQLHCRLERDG